MQSSNGSTRKRVEKYIETWEARCYSDGLPDSAPIKLERSYRVPSYRNLALCLMRNDTLLLGAGLSKPPSKAYSMIKKAEISKRVNQTSDLFI